MNLLGRPDQRDVGQIAIGERKQPHHDDEYVVGVDKSRKDVARFSVANYQRWHKGDTQDGHKCHQHGFVARLDIRHNLIVFV